METSGADRERMVACLMREWETVKVEEGITKASTVFFGGGTPSLMYPEDVEKILRRAKFMNLKWVAWLVQSSSFVNSP